MGTKIGHIYGKGAPFKGAPERLEGQLPQTAPPGFATDSGYTCVQRLRSC